jgi:hypothetical protein
MTRGLSRSPRVQHWQVSPADWPAGLRLRVALVADLHAGPPQMPLARVATVMRAVQALAADLIVLAGDFRATIWAVRNPVPIEAVADHLAGLRAPLGVHAVLGNHDWWDDPATQQRRGGPVHAARVLAAAGIGVLQNRATRIAAPGGAFWLAGLDSQRAIHGPRRRHEGRDDLAGTLAQVTDAAPVILVAHEPDIFPQVPARVAVTLSGHTHGGQIRLGPWVPVVPSRHGARYAWGHIREGGRDLVVSGGLGCSGLPLRLGRPPELTLVTLAAAARAAAE